MEINIDWEAFLHVFIAALLGATTLVTFYAMALRLMVRAGHAPVVSPAEFTDAISVITDKERIRALKAAAKASKRSPLTVGEKRLALVGAYVCFGVCIAVVIFSILLIFFNH